MKKIRWTEEEISYLKDNYSKYGMEYCVEKLNRTIVGIEKKVRSLNLLFRLPITDEELDKYSISQVNENLWVGYRKCFACVDEIKYQSNKKFYTLRNIKKAEKNNTLCVKCKSKGEKNPFFNKKHSIETKLQVSKSRVGKACGENNSMAKKENRDKVSAGLIREYGSGRLDYLRLENSYRMKKTHTDGKIKNTPISIAEKEIKSLLENNGYKTESQFRIRSLKYDLFLKEYNVLIEYNGDYWHCNPEKYKSDYFNKKKGMLAHELWEQDKLKKELAEKNGYKLFTIWEKDYIFNKEKEINKITSKL